MSSSILEVGLNSLGPVQLEISSDLKTQAWQQAKQCHSNVTAQYNAYINYICTYTFKAWLEEWLEEEPDLRISIWPNEKELPTIWEVVNGTGIALGNQRVILIPNEKNIFEELEVPQEWINIPSWSGNYYVALQVVVEGEDDKDWVNIWGFTTHQQLRQAAHYSDKQRSYTLATDKLIEDLTVMQMTLDLVVKEGVKATPKFTQSDIKKLIDQLSDKDCYSPRLHPDLSFQAWAALLENKELRQELYERRVGITSEKAQAQKILLDRKKEFSDVNLRKWLTTAAAQTEHFLEKGWQALEFYFSSSEAIPIRGTPNSSRREPESVIDTSKNEINSVLKLLRTNQSEEIRRQAAGVLGEIGGGQQEAINALTHLLDATKDEETRWQAAFSLGKLDPGNPKASVRKARLIDLGINLSNQKLLLVVAVIPKTNNSLGIFLKVLAAEKNQNLPPGLKLSVFSGVDENVIPGLEVEARGDEQRQDKLLQLRFSPPVRSSFRVKISLRDKSITESFIT
ncbi:DUF1822 family protein [Leptolyngbya cf. ectocarpi LEGE 11479]|uniref:DUF1822 family protein n=1 Tax=Leptolyngbya cf. ectocarpi LEGE 11479 TaxID=1828722 RepID=A0A929FDS6_LEPEC|nr:DUF1822 family protein [Leptolyngbya ectocarpi]MBE9070883.1 DUF1822 family protein [Leptolyngbya cf. ectocarpi LEGE 11479]